MGGKVPSLDEVGQQAPPHVANMLRREVAVLLDRGGSINFPGAQPVSFARKHLLALRQRDFYVCEKSDGIRCLLYFTNEPELDQFGQQVFDNNQPVMKEAHYLIDRKNDYYSIPNLHFPLAAAPNKEVDWASYHKDSLLDGELLWDEYPDGRRVMKFLVFDCLVLDKQNLTGRTLDKRLAYFMDKVYAPYARLRERFPEDCEAFVFTVEKKSFQFGYGTKMMFEDILPNVPHGSDGLIFTCVGTPYKMGTDENILKWKPANENTVDFKMGLEFPPFPIEADDVESGDEGAYCDLDYDAMPKITLHIHHGDRDDRPYEPMYATPDEWEKMKQWAIERQDGLHGQIVECHKDEENRWRFNRFREDKTDANYVTTVTKVIESIEDSVSMEELIEAAGEIKKQWKARQLEREKEEARKRAIWEAAETQKRAKRRKEMEAQQAKMKEASKE